MEPLHHIQAGVLNIAYHACGPAEGTPVFLLHGFPYDIHSYAEVAPLLAAALPQEAPRVLADAVLALVSA